VEAAEKHELESDQEMSFCLYLKYMNVLTKIQKRLDYTKEKTLVGKMVGNDDTIDKYFDTLVKLKSSLEERYAKKYPASNVEQLAKSRILDDFIESLSKIIGTDKENNEDPSIMVGERTSKKQLEETKDTQERAKLKELEEQLRQKENERKQIHEERERKRKEREEALRLVRERILSPKSLGNQEKLNCVDPIKIFETQRKKEEDVSIVWF
jgi:USP8 dimerisation domain